MNVLSRVTLRHLKVNRRRTIVTIVGIMLSVALITAVAVFASTLLDYLHRNVICEVGEWHAVYQNVPTDQIDTIRQSTDVQTTFLTQQVGYGELEDSKNADKPYLYVQAVDDVGLTKLPIRLKEGALPQAENEIVLADHLRTNGGLTYKIGDTLTLDFGKRQIVNGGEVMEDVGQNKGYKLLHEAEDTDAVTETLTDVHTRTYTVVGICERPGNEPSTAPGYSAFTYLPAAIGNVNVYTVNSPLRYDIYKNDMVLSESLGVQVEFNSDLLRYSGVTEALNVNTALYTIVAIVIAIIMVSGVSMIRNSFYISMAERQRDLGVLTGVGATARQKRKGVYTEAATLGAIGIPLGLLLGIGGMALTFLLLNPSIQSLSPYGLQFDLVVSPIAVLVAVVAAAVTVFISALTPALKSGRLTPMAAIRQTADIKLRPEKLRTGKLIQKLFGFEGVLAHKNLGRNPKRTRTTVSALAISVILFLSVAFFVTQVNGIGGFVGIADNKADISVTSYTSDPAERQHNASVLASIGQLDNIQRSETVTNIFQIQSSLPASAFSAKYKQLATANDDGSYTNSELVAVDDATWAELAADAGISGTDTGQAIMINDISVVAPKGTNANLASLNVCEPAAVGTTINISYQEDGDEESPGAVKKATLTLAGLTDLRPLHCANLQFSAYYNLVVSQATLTALAEQLDYSPRTRTVHLQLADQAAYEKTAAEVTELSDALQGERSVRDHIGETRTMKQLGLLVLVLGIGFITLITLVSVTNIINTISTGVELRTRESAMLKSVGMGPRAFNRMMRCESLFYGLRALLWGLPISLAVMFLMHLALTRAFSFGFAIPWLYVLYACLGVFAIIGITMVYATHKTRHQNVIDGICGEV